MKFKELNIIEPILKALAEKGYEEPTPIQEEAIPQVLNRRDVLGVAQTGTGKTAAFSIPIIQLINKKDGEHHGRPHLRSLIVTPTRELAIQIGENIKEYSKNTIIRHAVIFGGVKQNEQVRMMKKGVHILVATPGRLLDLIGQGFISLREVKLFVLDEADRMLDMGFIHDINKLIDLLPEQRQSLFFSATMPENIVELSKKILKNPVRIEVTPASTTAETIQQHLYYTNRDLKHSLLVHILESKKIDQALVFSRTKHGSDRIARKLKKDGIDAASIHGDKSQPQRQKALKAFKAGKTRVLVATDIAARGIDIDKLKYVINYDIPNEPESYVHRIGRSGRAGEEGYAISICEPEENAYIKDVEKLIGQKIDVVSDNPYPQTDKPMTDAEKKEWQKEKNRRKQEFFANRKRSKHGKGSKSPKGKKKDYKDKQASDVENQQSEKNRDRNPKSKRKKDHPKSSFEKRQKQDRPEKKKWKGRRDEPEAGNQSANADQKTTSNSSGHSKQERSDNKDWKNKKRNGKNNGTPQSLRDKYMWPLEK
ncbi:DEAD/DEAH box helicase [Portibacter marinus]|uniref:DEAD/DEAH box helicase n=1 Tax=Portibacter marinus TaxID=2898660 RepID=UPI001F492B2A|nr:DEAD/DEAH box helicase [Portibacter marinus]